MEKPDRILLQLLPRVLRARDYHLYLENGKRITDLWLAGGKAILGHKPPRVLGELKNAGERGLFTALPHHTEKRFIKALTEFFPEKVFRIYTGEASMHKALEEVLPGASLHDPAFSSGTEPETESVCLWRPFLEPNKAAVMIPVLPWPLSPEVLALEKSMASSFPPGELIAPVLLAPVTRALYDLAALMKLPGRSGRQYPKINRALGSPGCIWRRRGIYLTVKPDMDSEKYRNLFLSFLEGGFLLPPSAAEPAILPASMSDGEESNLAELLVR